MPCEDSASRCSFNSETVVLCQFTLDLPAMIAFSRVGSHWLNCVIELYFDRPVASGEDISFLDEGRSDWLAFKVHDSRWECPVHPNVLYLYREPVGTIWSNIMYAAFRAFGRYPVPTPTSPVNYWCWRYRKHLERYLLDPVYAARTTIRYEGLQQSPVTEFRKVARHFGAVPDDDRARWAFGQSSRKAMFAIPSKNAAALNPAMLWPGYARARQCFSVAVGAAIRDAVITPALAPFFEPLDPEA